MIKRLYVSIGGKRVGRIEAGARYDFVYDEETDPANAVSVTMPPAVAVYPWRELHPIFAQNLPEGYLGDVIRRTISKTVGSDDLSMLSVLGQHQIGRLRYALPDADEAPADGGDNEKSAKDILTDVNPELFAELFEKHYLRSGLSGVQPKVLLGATAHDRITLRTGGYILKSWGDDYPELAANEFFCMRVAEASGVRAPRFDLSENGRLFLMDRFDVRSEGVHAGFEDGCVLQGRSPSEKYKGSYERLAKSISTYVSDDRRRDSLEQLFRSVVVSWAVRNGDAHLKNFGILYDDITGYRALAPAFDIVSTVPYLKNDVPALTLAGKKLWWPPRLLAAFGVQSCGLRKDHVGKIFGQVMQALLAEAAHIRDYIDRRSAFSDVGNAMIQVFRNSAAELESAIRPAGSERAEDGRGGRKG